MKRAFQTWSFFLKAQFRAEKLKNDEKYAAELKAHALEALGKPCHQRSSLDITRICAWFRSSKIFGKKKIPPASLLIIAKEAAVWSGPANKVVFFQGMRGDGTGPGQKDAWWQWGYYVILSGKVNLYSFSDKAQEAHALSRFVLSSNIQSSSSSNKMIPGSPNSSHNFGNGSSRRESFGGNGTLGGGVTNWSQDLDADEVDTSDVLSQSASGRSMTSSSHYDQTTTTIRNFDPPKSDLGVPEMQQMFSPTNSKRQSPLLPSGDNTPVDESLQNSTAPLAHSNQSPLTFEPLSPSFNTSSYTAQFSRKEQNSRRPQSVAMLEEPSSPSSGGERSPFPLRRQSSKMTPGSGGGGGNGGGSGSGNGGLEGGGNDPLSPTGTGGDRTLRRRNSSRNNMARSLNRQDSLNGGLLSPKEPPSGGSMGTPGAFKRSNSITSSPSDLPAPVTTSGGAGSGSERNLTRRGSMRDRGKTPERINSAGGMTSMGSSHSLMTPGGRNRRLLNRDHSNVSNKDDTFKNTGQVEPGSAAMSVKSSISAAGGAGAGDGGDGKETQNSDSLVEKEPEVDFLTSGILGDLIFSSSNFGHTFGEIALTDKQNPVRTTAAVLAEPTMLLVIGPDAFARSMQSEVVEVMDMRKKLEFLERPRGLFGKWRNAQLAQMSYVMTLKTFLPRDVIHEQGSTMNNVMFVKQGHVRAVMTLKGFSGKEEKFQVEVGRLGEGSILDDVGLVDGGSKYTATFIADSVVEVLSIKLNDFDKMIANGIGQAKTTHKDIKLIAEVRRERRFSKVLEAKQKFADIHNEKDNKSAANKKQSSTPVTSRHPFRTAAYDMAWTQAISKTHNHHIKKKKSNSNTEGENEPLNENSVLKFTKVKGILPTDHLPTASAFSLFHIINDPLPPV
eukprot:CAMPEP_0114348536 /NCGR_PEP_ID=MMETSP0101-20121206/14779_1 /TAXON_ID=38822 ORGANISM="Pteridomonas danica, Strain PT" /NCGR_SAMPLE_ID=MMETSP0101 /ASSEMBLY_ACC=CAM_ASM_000211 /LENGTH=893 /DNA_ID=CAMNT_0001486505 /DNA_START=157 /DNA_END=2838 /DNA_ORIENTATION=+